MNCRELLAFLCVSISAVTTVPSQNVSHLGRVADPGLGYSGRSI